MMQIHDLLAIAEFFLFQTQFSYHQARNVLLTHWLPVWLSDNTLVSINIVTQRRARLVSGWVTVFGRVNHLGAEPGTQVYSA